MIIYRVYSGSYEGAWSIKCFTDKDAAIEFARAEARKTNEEFGGGVGYGIGIETLSSETGECSDLGDWQDWKVTIKGARFVLTDDTP